MTQESNLRCGTNYTVEQLFPNHEYLEEEWDKRQLYPVRCCLEPIGGGRTVYVERDCSCPCDVYERMCYGW